MKKIITLSLVLVFSAKVFTSCDTDADENSGCSNLEASAIIKIDVKGRQYNHQSYQIIDHDGDPYLYGVEIGNKTIDVFDLEKGEYNQALDYSSEKLNINEIDQFYVHNHDSIFLFSIPLNTLYLIDNESNLTDEWEFDLDYEIPQPNLFVFNVLAFHNYFNGFYYDNVSEQFISTVFFFDGQNFLNENAYNFPPVGRFKLTSNEQVPIFSGKFPPSYSDIEVPFDMFYNLQKKGENTLVNFSFSSKVLDEKNGSFMDIKSRFDVPAATYAKSQDPTLDKVIADIHSGFLYLKTFELDNRNLLRICKHEQSLASSEGVKNELVQAPWSVIEYDQDSKEVLNEYCFEANTFDFRHVLPYKNGFYVLKENPFDELNNEEILEVHYYSLK